MIDPPQPADNNCCLHCQASTGRPTAVHGAAREEDEHVGPAESPGGEEDRGH